MLQKNKKIPIKGEVVRNKEQKPCSSCGKSKPLANKTKRLCATCLVKERKEKQRARKEYKKRIKQETITQSKLDQVTSWLIRAAHEEKCHSCEIPLDPKQSQCCHFVGRTKGPTRHNLLNLLPGCRTCNLFTPHHVWNLGKSLNKIWGETTTEDMLSLSAKHLKLSNNDRKLIYNVFKHYLDVIQNGNHTQKEKYDLLREANDKYEQIVNPLITNFK
jgi:hypothetical protein